MFALDILNQLQNENGSLLSDGRIYVYYLGRTRLADIYNDIDGQIPLPNPVILDNLGMSEIYLSNAYDYTVVVTDPYGTELFSRDIFTSPLQEGGANARLYEGWDPIVVNNNVNVISAKMATFGVESPLYFAEDSESATVIGISGELGKTYSGIDPIVVNNELNKISANTKTLSAESPLYITDYEDKTVISVQSAVLGVQEPLYFVENSETATVIGIQGSAITPEGTMNESAFGYEDGKITGYNGSGFSAGLNYSGIDPIVVNNEEAKISANTIGITGISPIEVVEYNDVLVISANMSSYASNSALSSKLDTSSFSSVSGDFLTAIPDEYATKDYVLSSVSSKLDVSSFSSVSSTFLTAVPEGTMNESSFAYDASNNITAYNGSAFKAGDEFPQSATEAIEVVTANSATWNTVSDKLDASASANFELVDSRSKIYSAAVPVDYKYITEVQPAIISLRNENSDAEIEQYTKILQNRIEISGDYNQGNYVNLDGEGLTISSHNSGFAEFNGERYSAWNEVSSKLDSTIYATDSGNFATTGDLNDLVTSIAETYQPTAGMTAYANSADVTGTAQYGLTTAGWAEITGGGGVSGTNVIFEPHYEGATHGDYYSATISGDVIVTKGYYDNNGAEIHPMDSYSLSSIGANLGNKLDKNKIEDSNTIAIIDNHAEVTDKAYRQTGFSDISAYYVNVRLDSVTVDFRSIDAGLYSAIVTVETTASAESIPDGWSLVSYENNSATFTRYYPLNNTYDSFRLDRYQGWGDFTNAEASATVYSALEIAPLAFKDDITGITYTTGSI